MSSPLSTSRKGPRVLLASLLTALTLLVWPASEASATTHQITIKNYAYGSGSMGISQGDTVTWTNKDSVPHDVVVTNGPVKFRSPMLTEGQSWSYTFTRPGSYSYTCSVHPDMKANVTANAKAVAPAPADTKPAPAPTTGHTATAPSATHATPTPTPTTESAAPGAAYAATTADQSEASLDPLLLLLGLSTSIVVFCLLLLASRPHTAASEVDPDGD